MPGRLTALHFAAIEGYDEVAEVLLQHGRHINDDIHRVLIFDTFPLIGAKVNIANTFGNTPLHEASKAAHPTIVLMLLEAGQSTRWITSSTELAKVLEWMPDRKRLARPDGRPLDSDNLH